MVRHVILWKLKPELTEEQAASAKQNIKNGLESLAGVIPGLKGIHVYTEASPTSNCDLMLDSLFEDMESLLNYHHNPAHLAVKNNHTDPAVCSRICFDTEEA